MASSFFAGINISINSIGMKSLSQQLNQIYADVVISSSDKKAICSRDVNKLIETVSTLEDVRDSSVIGRIYSIKSLPVRIKLPEGTTKTFRQGFDLVIGVSESSYLYKNWNVEYGNRTLGKNEVYVEIDSEIASNLSIGDNVTLKLYVVKGFRRYIITKNLTIAGLISLDDQAFLMAYGRYALPVFSPLAAFGIPRFTHNLLITSWNTTFSEILDEAYSYSPSISTVTIDVIVDLEKENLVNPWDIDWSKEKLQDFYAGLENVIGVSMQEKGFNVRNLLLEVIQAYENLSTAMILQGVILALPVFFVAWYVGLTVSNVSFHLRRREIGLLSTKGFSSSQLLRLFLMEAALIGVLGSIAGLVLGVIFTPIFSMGKITETPKVDIETIILVTCFSVAISLLAVYKPARNASEMKTVDALREYIYIEEIGLHRKVWIWLALALGTYKMIMLLLGLDLAMLLPTFGRGGPKGFLLNLLFQISIFFDNVLTYIGPILFFWGFSKIFIEKSLKFQNALSKVTGLLTENLSVISERNIRRNASRIASITFLLAIIIGYSVSSVGQISSQKDYTERLIKAYVGADVSVIVSSVENVTDVINAIRENIAGIERITVEYTGFSGQSPFPEIIKLVAIDPQEWILTAYYEDGWFKGFRIEDLPAMLTNNTIILDGRFSKYLQAGDQISITLNGKDFNLTVIGFFGEESSSVTGLSLRQHIRMRQTLNSFVNLSIYECVNDTVSATPRILIDLKPGVDGEEAAEEIRKLEGVEWVVSVDEQIRFRDENILLSGILNVMKLGVFFAALAASIGVSLVTLVTMQERKKEITLFMVRGLSLKQVVAVLLTENLGVLLVALALGGIVGYLVDRGNVAAMNVMSTLIIPRIIFPYDAILTLAVIGGLLASAAVIPVIIMVLIYSSKMVWRT